MSLGPLYVLLGEVSVQVLCPFLNWIVCLPGMVLEIKLLSAVSLANIFSHTVGSLFILLVFSLAMKRFFEFDVIPFVYSFFYIPCSRGHIGENIAAWDI